MASTALTAHVCEGGPPASPARKASTVAKRSLMACSPGLGALAPSLDPVTFAPVRTQGKSKARGVSSDLLQLRSTALTKPARRETILSTRNKTEDNTPSTTALRSRQRCVCEWLSWGGWGGGGSGGVAGVSVSVWPLMQRAAGGGSEQPAAIADASCVAGSGERAVAQLLAVCPAAGARRATTRRLTGSPLRGPHRRASRA